MNTVLPAIVLIFSLCHQAISIENKFPDDFLFGVASSAYQIEGGHDKRGETVLDHYQRLDPSIISDSSDAKIACDSYHKYHEDINLLEYLGVDFYRFSISWPRILPTGYSNKINPDGIRYYNNLIDGLISKNITPMVTIFHYDLPKPLQDLGGWFNPTTADLFEDYSKILFKNFGDRVKFWITLNANTWGYADPMFPPMLNLSGLGEYLCYKTILLAHAKAYHLYKKEFRDEQKGQVGLTIDGRWYHPATTSTNDIEAAERVREFLIGTLANPIFGEGDFPKVVKERVAELSHKENFLKSRLPQLSPEEVDFIKGSYDFLGLNSYTTYLIKDDRSKDNWDSFSESKDLGAKLYQDPEWPGSLSDWLKVVPWGLRGVLKWVKDKYNNPPVFITENGFSDSGELEDEGRIQYYKLHLEALLEAIHEDGVNVKGYAAWSLLDNFEWMVGYSEKFGLFHVDFSDPARPRTPKSSARWYKSFLTRRHLAAAAAKTEL
ncbi:myrosinase 1-like [Zophobas morio]|uniref:myrosinase 1-like n=1 Tax=Zophobas morio TaxID=2755281 RepID=UPI0030831F7D